MTVESEGKVFESADEWLDHLERKWAARPWYEKVQVRVERRWKEMLRLRHEPRYAWQRVRRGYSEQDTWSLDHHLASVIVGALTQLLERRLGHPARITGEQWDMTLATIIGGFKLYLEKDWSERTAEDNLRIEEAKQKLMMYFEDLWD